MAAASGDPPQRNRPESRRAPRRASGSPGVVRIAGYRLNVPCRIVDLSATGARLVLMGTRADHLPDRVIVGFSDRTEIDAEIRWRKDNECGVRFLSFFRQAAKPPAAT